MKKPLSFVFLATATRISAFRTPLFYDYFKSMHIACVAERLMVNNKWYPQPDFYIAEEALKYVKLENYQALLWWIALFHIFSQSFKLNCWNSHFYSFHHGYPFLRLGPYLGGEGMYQKSENMWSFQMTPSNYRYVIFMWPKCLLRETAWQKTPI